MQATDEDWKRVADAVELRLAQIPVSPSVVTKYGGTDPRTLSDLLEGKRLRSDAQKRICKGLGWTVDSISRILAGDEPAVDPSVQWLPLEERVEVLEGKVEDLTQGYHEMREELRLLSESLDAAERERQQ